MIIEHNGEKYLKIPFEPGEKVYICTNIDWDLGIIPATVYDLTAYYSQKTKDYFWMIDVDHEHLHSKNNPALIINRYNFTEEELAKTPEEARVKLNNRILQAEAKKKVDR